MEFFKNVGFEIHVDELAYDLGFTGYVVVYQQFNDLVRPKHLFFGEDHVFVSRGEAGKILRSLAVQYIERELFGW